MSNNDNLSVDDYGKICRTCLNEGEMRFLYEKFPGEMCLSEMLMSITYVQFSEMDGFPAQICLNCEAELTRAYRFAQKCCEVDKKLRITKNSEGQIKIEENYDIHPEIFIIKPEILSENEYNSDENILEQNDSDSILEHNERSTIKTKNPRKMKVGPPFECRVCLENFESYKLLCGHWKEVKHPKTSKIACKICLKKFTSSHMIPHMRTHSGERPFCCEVCGKRFITSSKLTRHRLIHTGERPNKCATCEKSFTDAKQLKEHMRVHTGERPYACNSCGQQFRVKRHLVQHTRIHTGDRPYKCSVCERNFAQTASLKAHMRSHTGDKPAVCNHCGKRFTSNGLLNWHLKSHAVGKPAPSIQSQHGCVTCKRNFKT